MIKFIEISLTPKKEIKNRLIINNKYFIKDNNNLCYGKYILNVNRNENRFIFKDVYFINYKYNYVTHILSTTDSFLTKVLKLDLGLPIDLQKLIEQFY